VPLVSETTNKDVFGVKTLKEHFVPPLTHLVVLLHTDAINSAKLAEITAMNATLLRVVLGVKPHPLVWILPSQLVSGLTHVQTVALTDIVIHVKTLKVVSGAATENAEDVQKPTDVSFNTLVTLTVKDTLIALPALPLLDVVGVTTRALALMLINLPASCLTRALTPTPTRKVDLMEDPL